MILKNNINLADLEDPIEAEVKLDGYQQGYDEGYTDGSFWWQRVRDFNRLFYMAEFPENTELILDISNDWRLLATNESNRYYDLQYAFGSCKGLKSIKIVASEKLPMVIQYAFSGTNGAEIVDLSNCPLIRDMRFAFQYNYNLKEIVGELDCSYLISSGINSNSFTSTFNLETIRFKVNTISFSIGFANSSRLNDDSIKSIINGLADLTSGTQQTLTLHSTVKSKLTNEQIKTVYAKNWNIG